MIGKIGEADEVDDAPAALPALGSAKARGELKDRTEMDALIAYLQVLGTVVRQKQ